MAKITREIVAVLCIGLGSQAFGQAKSDQPEPTIRANSTLVVVDVVVTDAQKNPVHNLQASDFTVLEDGKPQTVKVFEEHSPSMAKPMPPMPKLDPGVFTNYSPAPPTSALNVLLLDTLNTPISAQAYVHDQVLKFIKEARPGVPIAIFGLGTQLRLLQGFTSDPEVLRSVINSKRSLSKTSPLMDNPMTDNTVMDNPTTNAGPSAPGTSLDSTTAAQNFQQFLAQQQSFQLQLRAQYTLDAMNQLARYLGRLPGRKNLIWFSGSFPINILPDGDLPDPFGVVASMQDEFRETTDLLARSQVAVYPIDGRGLMTSPVYDASVSGKGFSQNPNAFVKANDKFFSDTAAEHSTMMEMADATGGRAFVNTNDLTAAVEKAIEAGSSYYTLAYSPSGHSWKGEYRKIQVKLAKQGVTLAYRRGYFADDTSAPAHHGDAPPAAGDTATYKPMRQAMLHGAPDPTEIVFEARVVPVTGEEEPAVAKGNQVNSKLKGPYRRYSVRFMANPDHVDCPVTPDGVHHCSLEFMTFVYDADGVMLNTELNGVKADIPEERYAIVRRVGLQFQQEISVPVKGESFLRIGLHDLTSDRVGAIEIHSSVLSKTPLPAPAQK
jgi:VWFA-related protein